MRLIDADELINSRPEYLNQHHKAKGEYNRGWNACNSEWYHLIKEAPTTEVPEPARWEPSPVMPGYVRCSGCHNCHVADDWLDGKKWKHCPECGAPMENGGQQHGDN